MLLNLDEDADNLLKKIIVIQSIVAGKNYEVEMIHIALKFCKIFQPIMNHIIIIVMKTTKHLCSF